MKFATFALPGTLLLGSSALIKADVAGASQVALGFNGGSAWTSSSTGAPVIDRQHSYLLWVSDFSVQVLPAGNYFLGLAPAGTATIYFSANPTTRDFTDLTKRGTWGVPVAVFERKASLVRSADGLVTDTFVFPAELLSSETFNLGGIEFDFKDLLPHGMTCHEYGQNQSSWESGTCFAIGGKR